MDGFTYIKNVLESDGRDVDKLLFKLCKRENSAVEFKASFLPKKGSGDNADACSWNVVSDVIAIANSAGGCILLGIDNDGEYASDFTSGLSLDEYTRRLHDHLSNKKEWVFDQKKYTVAQKYRDRLKDCLTVLEGFAYGKDILVIHIKPSNKPIVYEETKLKGNNPPSEYLTHRSKGAIAQKNQIPLSAEAIEEFLERETSSPYFDQLWDEYSGNQRVQKQNLWIAFISVFFAILTMTQCYLVYNNTTTATEFIFLLSSIPILFLANVLLVFIFHATRKIILYFLTLGWISFSISSVFFALRLFSATNDSVAFSSASRILISLGIFLGISIFLFFIFPVLVPTEYRNIPHKGNLPRPDEIFVDHPRFTIEWRCVNAGFFWSNSETIHTPYGDWQLQRNRVFGNFRLLDPRSIMRCYGGQKEVLLAFRKVQAVYEGWSGSDGKG